MTRHEIYTFQMQNVGYDSKIRMRIVDMFYRASQRANNYHTGI